MRCVWRDKNGRCQSHRWRDWYLCLGHINAIRVTKLVLHEEEARKVEMVPLPKPRGGGGMPVREYFGLAASAK